MAALLALGGCTAQAYPYTTQVVVGLPPYCCPYGQVDCTYYGYYPGWGYGVFVGGIFVDRFGHHFDAHHRGGFHEGHFEGHHGFEGHH